MVFLQYHLLQDIVSILDMSGNWADVNSSVSVARITGKSIWIYTATDGQSDSPCMCDLYMLTRMLSLLGFPGYAFTFVSWAALNYSFWYKMSHGLIRERQGACTTMCFIRKKKRKGRFPWPWPAHVDSHLLMNSISNDESPNPRITLDFACHRSNAMERPFTAMIVPSG